MTHRAARLALADNRRLLGEVSRAEQAEAILSSRLYEEAWTSYEDAVLTAWRNTHSADVGSREQLWLALHVANKVRAHLRDALTTGRMAAIELRDRNG